MNDKKATNSRGHARYSEDDRNQLMEAYAESRMTKKAFCRERGINIATFYWWMKRAKQKRKTMKISDPKFREVSIPVNAGHDVEIMLPGGARVCLRNNGNQENLAKLIREVAGC